jgi:hypothetical protein
MSVKKGQRTISFANSISTRFSGSDVRSDLFSLQPIHDPRRLGIGKSGFVHRQRQLGVGFRGVSPDLLLAHAECSSYGSFRAEVR